MTKRNEAISIENASVEEQILEGAAIACISKKVQETGKPLYFGSFECNGTTLVTLSFYSDANHVDRIIEALSSASPAISAGILAWAESAMAKDEQNNEN